MGGVDSFHHFNETAVYLDGGSADILDFVADDGFLAGEALHVGLHTYHRPFDDTHLLPFFQRTGAWGDRGADVIDQTAEVVQFLVADTVTGAVTRHGEHLVHIGTETDVVEMLASDMTEYEGGKQDLLPELALVATTVYVCHSLKRNPRLEPLATAPEIGCHHLGYAHLAVAADHGYIPTCIVWLNWLCMCWFYRF